MRGVKGLTHLLKYMALNNSRNDIILLEKHSSDNRLLQHFLKCQLEKHQRDQNEFN